jgi:hypothetical protein
MEKSNNLETYINEALTEAAQKWSKIIPSLKGKHAKHNLAILTLLMVYGDKSTWDLAKLYLEKVEPQKVKNKTKEAFFHARMVENSTIYKRLKDLEQKGYVTKIGKVHHATVKACFLVMLVNPKIVEILPMERFNTTLAELQFDKPTEEFASTLIAENEPVKEEIIKTFQNLVKEPVAAKTFSELFRNLLWSWKINLDEIEAERLLELMFTQIKRLGEKIKSKNGVTVKLPV